MVKRPQYVDRIMSFVDKHLIKVISGMRRSGKSTLLRLLMEELKKKGVADRQILYINKELIEFDDIRTYRDLDSWFKSASDGISGRLYLFVDEVQEIEQWERAINSILAEDRADITITGSNARLLSSDLSTLIAGRYVEIPLYPLSFSEFLRFRAGSYEGEALEEEFKRYLRYGGFPGIHYLPMEDEVIFQYLQAMSSTILLKDIVARYGVRDVPLLERIAAYIFANCGQVTSAKRITDYFKSQQLRIGVDTVQNYLQYFLDAHMAYRCKRYDIKGKRHLELYEKYYPADLGLRHAVLRYRDADIAQVLETVVYLELLRRGWMVSVGKQEEREVDFIAERKGEKVYIQVCYLLADPETVKREFGVLKAIPDHFPKKVLSLDRVWGEQTKEGIMRQHIVDFLLDKGGGEE